MFFLFFIVEQDVVMQIYRQQPLCLLFSCHPQMLTYTCARLQLRSYLMSYTSIGIDKIAQLNELSRDDFICAVVAMKHKSTQKEWGWGLSEGGPVSGTRTLALKFNFFLEVSVLG